MCLAWRAGQTGAVSPVFSRIVTDYWLAGEHDSSDSEKYTVIVDERLGEDLSLTLLAVLSGPRIAAVMPALANALSLASGDIVGDEELRARIRGSGLELNGADHLFYLPLHEQQALLSHPEQANTRRLTRADAAEFERFCSNAPGDDLEEAFVEIDHWLVYGTFSGDDLVAIGSAYPWRGTRLADIGVITLPAYRGRGLAKRVVRAIAGDALSQGYQPQYRCQLDNLASIALAGSAGFARFGEWDVVVAADGTGRGG
jgi:RimJ/RimL family protein N-acetyltransferase